MALLRGFPPEWTITGRKTAAYHQVGNAFPPPVAAAVGRSIALALTQTDASGDDWNAHTGRLGSSPSANSIHASATSPGVRA
ncbi:DNA cytosine methyltransferase [Streptomyces sp. NPDC058439]|uniref:DNA cytosine methyltransferase n=1 Tax=Streptomyces sp. NPDC058439 TaxID=3346500 RepID=UPI0036660DFF